MFVHGSGSTRQSPRNRLVARGMQRAGFATLLFDLLTPAEAAEDEETSELRFDIGLLTGRVIAATRWMAALPRTRGLRVGYFGASTGAAAALAAAARLPDLVAAVVSRGGRPDLVPPTTLAQVRAPVLLVVGSQDPVVLRLNRSVLPPPARRRAHGRAGRDAPVRGAGNARRGGPAGGALVRALLRVDCRARAAFERLNCERRSSCVKRFRSSTSRSIWS